MRQEWEWQEWKEQRRTANNISAIYEIEKLKTKLNQWVTQFNCSRNNTQCISYLKKTTTATEMSGKGETNKTKTQINRHTQLTNKQMNT